VFRLILKNDTSCCTQNHISKNDIYLIYCVIFLIIDMIVNCYFWTSFFRFHIECNVCCMSANLQVTCSQWMYCNLVVIANKDFKVSWNQSVRNKIKITMNIWGLSTSPISSHLQQHMTLISFIWTFIIFIV